MSSNESESQSTSIGKREGSPETGGPAKKKITLAISKEPPPKTTFSTPYATKKLSRPIYYVDNNVENIMSSISSTKGNSNTSAIKKKVRFRDDLVEIREYERNPEEWTSFDEGYRPPFYETNWRTPFELKLTPKVHKRDMDNVVVRKQLDTPEVLIQEKRERLVLGANYISLQHIPPSPAEPDEIPAENSDNNIPVIPLFNEPMEGVDKTPKPVINQNMITPENLNAAANIAAAINQVFKIPAQQSTYMAPTPQLSNYYSPPQYNTMATPAPVNQSQISNKTVEEMIKNNPDIMKSLKQLSRSAGDIFDASTITSSQQQSPNKRSSWNAQIKKNTPCTFYQNGNCRNGTKCPFSHEFK